MTVTTPLQDALAAIAEDQAQILEDMQAMLRTDTCFPPGNGYGAFADLMEQLIAPLGLECKRVSVPEALWRTSDGSVYGERINLMAEANLPGKDVCSLYFHTDTVPPGDGWTHEPLELTIAEGKLFGRGAADMKGTVVAALAALRAAKAANLPLRFSPSLLLCTDEEGGLYPGIRYLAEQGLVQGHILSFNGGATPRIWGGCFGSIDLVIRITGRSAHSGDPVGAINAIEHSLPLMNALYALKTEVEQRESAMPSPPHFEGKPLTSRLTLAAAHGGSKGSTVPGAFELLINRRYAPEEAFEDVMAELLSCIESAMKDSPVLEVSHEMIGHLAPVSDPVGPNQPRWQAAQSLGFGYAPEDFRVWGSSTSSDMGWVQQAGIEEMLLGGLARPDNRIHASDEYTTMEDVVALAQSILAYLAEGFDPAAA
ncbi:M20 family metallopeptidase [Pokkaliibacter sp. CJK22405]|uniref:M20 family metallopeptidase n=1 Tax=Pokkaliibacter sp. CJK22405 TaxID=3384615 RepID=UPI0039849C5A